MTTRKPATSRLLAAAGLCTAAMLTFAGCSTPGPNRGYYISDLDRDNIVQFDPATPDAAVNRQDSHLGMLQAPFGFAYDPFTDHFFIRLNPGNRFLVVDRPDRSIKRSFVITGVELPPGLGDIAIRSRDRHLFLVNPTAPELVETNLNGVYERTIRLDGLDRRPDGVAYDQFDNQLLTRTGDRVDVRNLDGQTLRSFTLDRQAGASGLSFDSSAREFFVPLAGPGGGLGVFSTEGRLLRTLPLPDSAGRITYDVGPHSLLRLF